MRMPVAIGRGLPTRPCPAAPAPMRRSAMLKRSGGSADGILDFLRRRRRPASPAASPLGRGRRQSTGGAKRPCTPRAVSLGNLDGALDALALAAPRASAPRCALELHARSRRTAIEEQQLRRPARRRRGPLDVAVALSRRQRRPSRWSRAIDAARARIRCPAPAAARSAPSPNWMRRGHRRVLAAAARACASGCPGAALNSPCSHRQRRLQFQRQRRRAALVAAAPAGRSRRRPGRSSRAAAKAACACPTVAGTPHDDAPVGCCPASRA